MKMISAFFGKGYYLFFFLFPPAAFVWITHRFYTKAQDYLGYAPSYNHPDPGTLPFYTEFMEKYDFCFAVCLFSIPAFLIGLLMHWVIAKKFPAPILSYTVTIFYIIAIYVFAITIEWIAD